MKRSLVSVSNSRVFLALMFVMSQLLFCGNVFAEEVQTTDIVEDNTAIQLNDEEILYSEPTGGEDIIIIGGLAYALVEMSGMMEEEETSSSSSGTSYNCSNAWTGSPSDVQVSSQCESACYSYNSGNTSAGDYSCAVVQQFGASSSCTVCN